MLVCNFWKVPQAKLEFAQDCKRKGVPTVPSTVDEEKQYNPFMRVNEESVKTTLGLQGESAIKVMQELRRRKDNF